MGTDVLLLTKPAGSNSIQRACSHAINAELISSFFVTKSALFVQTNVAVNTKLTSKVPFLFGNFQVF